MKPRVSIAILALVLLRSSFAAPVPESLRPEPFQDGDVIACVGDSIFHGGRFTQYLQLYYATHYPERDIRIINCGIGGHTAASTLRRLDWDILPCKPNVAVVMLGMNDVGITRFGKDKTSDGDRRNQEQRFEAYKANMTELVKRLQDAGTRVILATPTPYDQTAILERKNYLGANDMLTRFADWLVEFAPKHECKIVDFHYAMNTVNAEGQKNDPTFTIIGSDRVHPRNPGHSLMAWLFIKDQGLPVGSQDPYNGKDFAQDIALAGKTNTPEGKRLIGLSGRWHASMQRIRQIAYGRAFLEGRKVDVDDPGALEKAVSEIEANENIPAHRKRNARVFFENRLRRTEYEEEAASIVKEMRAAGAKMK